MSQQVINRDEHIDLLRKNYEKLTSDFLQLTQEKKIAQHMTKVEVSKAEDRLLEQKTHYETIISNLNKRVYELQENCKTLQGEENSLHRKEIRRYVEGINEKEVQINNLKRQINGLRNKIAGLEQEVNNLTNARQNYQIYVIKAVDQIRTSIKENRTFLEDMETQKMVLQSKYRQLTEKTVLIQNHIYEVEAQKKTIEENYNKIKQLYKNSRDECLELKYEVQKIKQAARKGEAPLNLDENANQDEIQIAKEVEAILDLKALINQCQGYLIQTNQYAELNESLIAENNQLKLKNAQIQSQIDHLRCRYESGYQDQLLRQKHPSLYDFLVHKREQIIAFQKNVERIESYMEEKDEQINSVINLIVHRQKQCTCGRQQEIQKLNQQLAENKKKIDFFSELTLKLKKDIQIYEQKTLKYIEEVKQLMDPKLKKKKVQKMRCRVCWLMCDKNQAFETCQDCNKNFHSDHCILNHACDSYSLEDGTSHYSGAIGQ